LLKKLKAPAAIPVVTGDDEEKAKPAVPNRTSWAVLTVSFSFAGMLLLAASVVIEIIENNRAKKLLMLETAEIPDVLSDDLEQLKQDFQTAHKAERVQARGSFPLSA
jgi:hypothetical protein